jgi:PilZ domain
MSDPEQGLNRRRAQRQSAVWMGWCHVEGEPSDLWRDCGVFDFSNFGLGMDLRHPSDLVGRRVSVRLPVGASIEVTLTGEVRNAKAGPDGVGRVGIEFVGLSKTERSIVDLLNLRPGSSS